MSKDVNFNWNLDNKKETIKQINILQIALCLACEDLSLYEDFTTAEFKAKCYIQQARESLKNDK